jgi:hypothetical protein
MKSVTKLNNLSLISPNQAHFYFLAGVTGSLDFMC